MVVSSLSGLLTRATVELRLLVVKIFFSVARGGAGGRRLKRWRAFGASFWFYYSKIVTPLIAHSFARAPRLDFARDIVRQ